MGPPSAQRLIAICLLLLTAIAIGAVLAQLRPVMVPLVVALFVTITMMPITKFAQNRFGMSHGLAATIALIAVLASLAILAVLVSGAAFRIGGYAETYGHRFREVLDRVERVVPAEWLGAYPSSLRDMMTEQVRALAGATAVALQSLLVDGALVLVFVVFLVFGRRAWRPREGRFWAEFSAKTQHYMLLKVLTSAGTGLFVGLWLWLLGVELADVFGLMAFLLNFVPQVGSTVATLLPLPVVIVDPHADVWTVVLAIGVPALVQIILGSFIEPVLFGDSVDLHPVAILFGLVFWGMIWGFVGVLLSVPLMAFVKDILARIEPLTPIADLMSASGAVANPNVDHLRRGV
jgi:AI-2 transport protein TqsA